MFHPYTNVHPEPLPMSKREYPDWPRGMSSPSDASISRTNLNEAEGLIPLQSEEPVGCFVVDCPSLHVIQRDELPRQLNHNPSVNADPGLIVLEHLNHCPRCPGRQEFRKARQVSSSPSTNFANTAEIVPSSQPLFRSSSPPLPEVVPTRPPSITSTTTRTQRITNSIPTSLFRFKKTSIASSSGGLSKEIQGNPLPSALSFCFCASGRNLLIWKKDGDSIISINIESRRSRSLSLLKSIAASEEDKRVRVKLAAGGNDWIAAVMTHKQRYLLLVLHSQGAQSHYALYPLADGLRPTCLAMSRDDSYVAVGYGLKAYLYHYKDCWQTWQTALTVDGFTSTLDVKFQVVNFSADSQMLVVATQRFDVQRTKDDDFVYAHVWACSEAPPPPLKLPGSKMSTDERGLSSVFYDTELRQSLVTGFTETPYPLFLLANGETFTPNKINFKIRCAAEAQPSSNTAVFMDSKNKVCKVDLRRRSLQYWGDLSSERGRLDPKEENAVIAIPERNRAHVFWRQGSGLWFVEMKNGRKGNRQNLRWLYDAAVDGS